MVRVVITGRTQEKLDRVVEGMSNTVGIAADVASEEDVKNLTDKVLEKYGRIDVVVNNAGIQRIHSVEEFPKEEWDLVLNTILIGTFLMTKYALPSMQENGWGRRVITISSGHGRRPDKYKSAYVAAKYGQIGFTETVAMENAQRGITANSILPGATNTELIRNQLAELAEKDGTTEQEALENHILGAQ